jgi:hypothetical protein
VIAAFVNRSNRTRTRSAKNPVVRQPFKLLELVATAGTFVAYPSGYLIPGLMELKK